MSLKRGTVFGIFVFCLVLGPTAVSAQQGIPARVAQLETQLDQALATIAQLQAALNAEQAARQAADVTLQNNINAISGGGVTQAVLDAAIGAEAAARAAADTTLQSNINSEASARAAFDATLAGVSALAPYVTVNTGTIDNLAGPHVIFSGVNVHIRSGHASSNSYVENGRGNLILGYNEPSDSSFPAERNGSHNLVVGPNHRYNFGVGLIVGGSSRLGGDGASVSGGFMNAASGYFSSVSSGVNNEASGQFSNVSAGLRNVASGDFAAVSGGSDNVASGNTAAVSAGQLNQATGDLSSVSGGFNNVSSAPLSTVGGGSGLVNVGPSTFVP